MLKTLITAACSLTLLACSSSNEYDDLNAKSQVPSGDYQLGIAFGGGGVRGFMHMGVIKALEEEGIKADVVSGTSAGSIAAVLYASGMSYQAAKQMMPQIKALLD